MIELVTDEDLKRSFFSRFPKNFKLKEYANLCFEFYLNFDIFETMEIGPNYFSLCTYDKPNFFPNISLRWSRSSKRSFVLILPPHEQWYIRESPLCDLSTFKAHLDTLRRSL